MFIKSFLVLVSCLLLSTVEMFAGTHTWSGAVDGAWSNPANWSSGGRPSNSESSITLIFPPGATRFNTTNNLAGLNIGLIQFTGGGYNLEGFGVGTNLNFIPGALVLNNSVNNTLGATLDLHLLGSANFNSSPGGSLTIESQLFGDGALGIDGGQVTLSCATGTEFTGTTFFLRGTLRLQNGFSFLGSWLSTLAIAGPLVIGTTNLADIAAVQLMESHQIATNANIIINPNGILDLNGKNNTVGDITITGGIIATWNGKLTMNGDLSAPYTPLRDGSISGNLSLGDASRIFHVSGGDFTIRAVISDDGSGRGAPGIIKNGFGNLFLATNNTYAGVTMVNTGILAVAAPQALGTTNSGTVVAAGAELWLSANVVMEPLSLSGSGFAFGAPLFGGGTYTWGGVITLNSAQTAIKSFQGYTLTLSNAIVGPGGLLLNGDGAVMMSGVASNTYAGSTVINGDGELLLNKSLNFNGVTSIPGPLIIGDSDSETNRVQVLTGGQIADSAPIVIHPSGRLELGLTSERIGPLTMAGGQISTIGFGVLNLGADVFATNGGSVIIGNMSLGGATRTFNVDETAVLGIVAAVTDGGAPSGIIKIGTGYLSLWESNSYSGATTINGGRIFLHHDRALGSAGGGTIVNSGGTLSMNDVAVASESLSLSGVGNDTLGSLHIEGNSTWGGPVTLATDTTVYIFQQNASLSITGAVNGPGALTKIRGGTLQLGGSQDNTFAGPLRAEQGTVQLSKTSGASAVSTALIIGNDTDPAETATVQLTANNQIANGTPVVIHKSGHLSLGSFSDTIGVLALTGGKASSGTGTLTLGGDLFATNAVQGGTINGHLSLGGSTRTFHLDADLIMNAIIADGGGNAGITKIGPGTLSMTTPSTYGGVTSINAGGLRLSSTGQPGNTTGHTVIADGAFLYLYAGIIVGGEALHLAGVGPDGLGALRALRTNTWTGPITFTGPTTMRANTPDDRIILSGVISGTGSLTKHGEGVLVLSGFQSNTFAGTTYAEEGLLLLDKSDPFVTAIPDNLVIGATSGTVAIVRWMENDQIQNGGPVRTVTVKSTGSLQLNSYDEQIGALIMDGGTVHSGSGTLTLGGDVTAISESFLGGISGRLSLGGVPREINVYSNVVLQVSASIRDGGLPAGLVKTGRGQLNLNSSNAFSGIFEITEGIVSVADDHALGTSIGGTQISTNGSLQLFANKMAEPFSLDGKGHGELGVIYAYGSNHLSGPVTLAGNSRITSIGTNGLITLSNVVSGPGALEKFGLGMLRLAGNSNNTYSGKTIITDGVLQLAKSNAVAIASPIEIGDGFVVEGPDTLQWLAANQIADNSSILVLSSGRLHLNGFTDTVGSISGLGNIELGPGILSVGANNLSTTYYGLISGIGGSITKIGSGTLTLTENNDFAGLATINGGSLVINGMQPLTAVLVQNGSIFGGTGLVSSITTVAGQVMPGTSPGRLRTGNLQLNNASQFIVELNGTNAGVNYDQIAATGNVGLGNAVLKVLPGFAGAVSNQFTIIRKDSANPVTSTFLGMPQDTLFTVDNNTMFQISYTGGDGNDVVLTQISMPSPPQVSTIALLPNGQIEIKGVGLPNVTYSVEANADLNTSNWIPIGSVAPQGNTLLQFIDASATNYTQRFYRFSWP